MAKQPVFRPDFYDLPICAVCGPVEAVTSLPGGHGVLVDCDCGESVIELPRRPRIQYHPALVSKVEDRGSWSLIRNVPKEHYVKIAAALAKVATG